MSAKFITVEGIEGSGKSSIVPLIAETIKASLGGDVVITREPGGTPMAESIRELFLREFDETIHPLTELLLVYAARVQHIRELILPNLKAGNHVVSDRFYDASLAYQGGGRAIDQHDLKIINKLVVGEVKPDLTFLLDIPVLTGMERITIRAAKDRMEQDSVQFFESVREEYLKLAKNEPSRIVIIDATKPIDVVHANVRAILLDYLES